MAYHPIIIFAAKDRVKHSLEVPFTKHYVATFPQIYKTETGAINFAKRNIVSEYEDDVWQLPGSKPI